MRRYILFLSLVVLLFSWLDPAPAQEKEYLQIIKQLMEDWNTGKISFDKNLLEPYFDSELSRRLKTRQFGYESPSWAQKRRNMWDSLDSQIIPNLPISKQGRMLLVGYLAYNLAEYAKVFKANEARNDLAMKNALILGPAQKSAIVKKLKLIDVRTILHAMANNETFTWPESEQSLADIEPPLRP